MRLGAPPPAECTQRPRQPSAPIRHFSCRHQRYIQEDFIDAGRLCLPGTSLLPAPEPSSCRLPRRACGLSATENRPLLSDDACRHPGFQRCWLNCGGQPLLRFLWTGVGEDIFFLTFRRDHIHQNSVRENQATATVKAMLGTGQNIPSHTYLPTNLWAPPQIMPCRERPYSYTASCLVNCFYQALNPPSIGGWGWTILVFSRCESNYGIVLPA